MIPSWPEGRYNLTVAWEFRAAERRPRAEAKGLRERLGEIRKETQARGFVRNDVGVEKTDIASVEKRKFIRKLSSNHWILNY